MVKLLGFVLLGRFLTISLYQLYLFQLKEYRWDRFREHLKRVWGDWRKIWWAIGLGAPISRKKLPRLTPKAVLFFLFQLGFVVTGWRLLWEWAGLAWLLVLVIFPGMFVLTASAVGIADRLVVYVLAWQAGRVIKKWRQKGLKIIGITGSFGKTTTVGFLNTLLGGEFKTISPPLGVNVEKAIAWSIIKNKSRTGDFLVVELGAYKKGEIASLCQWLKPEIVAITGIGKQHLGLFGSRENLLQAKSEILQFAKIGFFNFDNSGCRKIARDFSGKKIFYGRGTRADYRLFKDEERIFRKNGKWWGEQNLIIRRGARHWQGKVNFLGKEFLMNLTGAVAIADYLGVRKIQVVNVFPRLELPKQRLEIKTGKRGCLILDSGYNQSETSVLAGIKLLKRLDFRKKMIYLSGFIELGDQVEKVERKIERQLVKKGIKLIKDKEELKKLLRNEGKQVAIFLSGRESLR